MPKKTFDANKHIPSNGIWPEFLNDVQAAAYLNCTPASLRCARNTGKLWGNVAPTYLKIGRKVLYRRFDLDSWVEIKAKEHTHSSDSVFG